MEEILEIRDGCSTPEQLFKSLAFSRYLKIYKNEFVTELTDKNSRHQTETKQKIHFIESVCARDFVNLLDKTDFSNHDELERAKSLVKFFDGGFHHYRSKSYSRLVRLQNDIVTTGLETVETVKDKVSNKAADLSDLILETRRTLLRKVNLEHGVRRTPGMDATPSVTAGEISGHYFSVPGDYVVLAHVPLTIAADIKTGVDYSTPSNKRAYPFYELFHNPFDVTMFEPEQWVSVPLQVGNWLIVAYLHKSRGCIEMEPGLLNLFPFASAADIENKRKPDGIFVFGDPNAGMNDLGYYWDEKNEILIGLVPNIDELKYFGYSKKPILTLHNVLAIRAGHMPLHCGCTRYEMHFDENTDEPYIAEMLIKADDMGRVQLEPDADGINRMMFYGTETGAFACLDGFSEQAKTLMRGREVGYNQDTGSNARQIVPVTDAEEIETASELDLMLYMNNFNMLEETEYSIDVSMSVDEAIEHFRLGERVAAGSTQTNRGDKESSYWANPFPLLIENDGTVIHKQLNDLFQINETKMIKDLCVLSNRKEIEIGVAYTQLMAGVYSGNSDQDLSRCGYQNREEVEQKGPVHLAEDLIDKIKNLAAIKRERLGGKSVKELSITVALIGDSRTGKSETAEKMEGILGLQLV
ncbi:MAG: hypothetical protein HQL46_05155 [Gammaproteobacteria bacterium]|nr:hypothetical protein [Gammaproteobacteria bacterium]